MSNLQIQNQNQIFGPIGDIGSPTPVPGPNDRVTESGEALVTEAGEIRIIE
jgi:hypothetical protein